MTTKTALVTGASRGIGRAIAQRLAADGVRVAVHYGSNRAAALATVAAIEEAGGQAFPVEADLGQADGVDRLLAGLTDGLAGQPLDILVNNAAVTGDDATIDTAEDEFDRLFRINVRAPFFLIQRVRHLLSDGGRIINISSGVTWFAVPEVVYAMTKGALNVLGRSLANTLGERGITVNTIAPGITRSDMNPWLDEPAARAGVAGMVALGRPGEPEDIADAVAFFASPDSRWITGQVVDVNGGLYLGPKAPLAA